VVAAINVVTVFCQYAIGAGKIDIVAKIPSLGFKLTHKIIFSGTASPPRSLRGTIRQIGGTLANQ
jgi:hypothetical protein